MATIVQCPRCGTGVKLPDHASNATCPKCIHSFKRNHHHEDGARRRNESSADDGESQLPTWISAWGVSAFFLATLALFSAMLFGSRILSVSLAVLGLAAIGAGLAATREDRLPRDRGWFVISGGANLLMLGLIFFAGGLLNRFWAMDAPVPKPDPHLLVAVPINQDSRKGRTLKPEDWVDAAGETIQQGDVFFRIMTVQAGRVPERGEKSFLLVQFRLAGRGNEKPILFAGFGPEKHQALLKDEMGRSYAFLEQRKRKLPAGGIVFLTAAPETVEVVAGRFVDCQLVFDLPPGDLPVLHLELPASAWGRKGVCKFRIGGLFEPIVPEAKEN